MAEPVIVIHGVNVRDRDAFERDVSKLNRKVGDEWTFVPVYWGDIGGQVENIDRVIPQIGLGVRSDDLETAELQPLVASLLSGSMVDSSSDVRSETRAAEIVAAAASEYDVRGAPDGLETRRVIEEEWGNQRWLPLVRDEAALQEIGRAIAEAIEAEDDIVDVRSFDRVARAVRAVLRVLDRATGAVITLTAGNIQQYTRRSAAPTIGRFLGDVVVYESGRDAIQQRLREAVAVLGGGWGTEGRPISVLAHSLGGLVTFDSAVRADSPLHLRNFVTFGSQPAFFHVINRRYQLAKFAGNRIRLGATIERWLNVWQPLDLLAFVAGAVFETAGGQPAKDVMLPHLGSDPLWTHSVYWSSDVFAGEVRAFLLGSK